MRSSRNMETSLEEESDDEEDVIGCMPSSLLSSHKEEIDVAVNSLPDIIQSGDLNRIEKNQERYCKVLKLYLEQPNLLDSYVPSLVEKLLRFIDLPTADAPPYKLNELSDAALEYLEHLTTVRGVKVISRLLPHEVHYLDRLLLTLEHLEPDVKGGIQQRRMLLLWLWIVCKNPFDMRRFDSKNSPGSTMNRIISAVTPYLSGKLTRCHYVAALVLSQCVARTDGLTLLNGTIESCLSHLSSEDNSLGGLILLSGILKHVDRTHLLLYIDGIVAAVTPFFPQKTSNVLIRKFFVKAVQRIALSLLKPRVASWRYRRGKRYLESSLATSDQTTVYSDGIHSDEDISDEDVPEHVDWVLACLLEAIQDEDTTVRWSAAKGIGRICSRIPKNLAFQVIDAIVNGNNNFHRLAGHCSWHGACMSLAELSRRGFLLPNTLPKVFDIVQEALFYEEPLGKHSLGANVRDAACYILWSFSRAFEPEDLRPYLDKIATSLMCVILFDREIHLRRAASAAFQENVGRQSNFPDGIALLTIADYYAVGNRERCYTRICKEVSQFPKYGNALIDHLLDKKVIHWDPSIRRQAALALYSLSSQHASYLSAKLPYLLEGCTADNSIRRHGSLFALAYTLKGLVDSNKFFVSQDILTSVANVPEQLKGDFTNHRTGELTRFALAEFIRVLSSINLFLSENQTRVWLMFLEIVSVSTNPALRTAAASSVSAFFKSYITCNSIISEVTKAKIIKEIRSAHLEANRIGFCILAGALAPEIADYEVFETLSNTILKQTCVDKKWALAREAAIGAMSNIMLSQYKANWSALLFETLLSGLDDYTMDIHGDVGRFVRQKSMSGLVDMLVYDETPDSVREQYTLAVVKLLIQQSAEKIGRTRQAACNCIKNLLCNANTRRLIPNADTLNDLYKNPDDFIQDRNLLNLTILFSYDDYYTDIMQGLILSAGGLSEITGRYSAEAFLLYQTSLYNNFLLIEKLVSNIADLFEKGMKTRRIADAVLRFLPQLLARLPTASEYVDNSPGINRITLRLKKLLSSSNLPPTRTKMVLSAFSSLLLVSPSSRLWQTSIQLLAKTLSNPLPVIRRAAAEALLESIWAVDVDETVVSLLSETHWQDTSNLPVILEAAVSIQNILIPTA